MSGEELVARGLPELVSGRRVMQTQLAHAGIEPEHAPAPVGELERAEGVSHAAARSSAVPGGLYDQPGASCFSRAPRHCQNAQVGYQAMRSSGPAWARSWSRYSVRPSGKG